VKKNAVLVKDQYVVMERPHWFPSIGRQISGGDSHKNPMLIVGSNAYMHKHVGKFMQDFNIHLMFSPTSENYYRLGLVAISKNNLLEVIYLHVICKKVQNGFYSLFESLSKVIDEEQVNLHPQPKVETLNRWIGLYIQRCSKISLKDVLHLEEYKDV
jgi:hypothetical protein